MKSIRSALTLLAALSFTASAADFNGTWKAVFTGPKDFLLKSTGPIVFKFQVDGNQLTGQALQEDWPFDAAISEGRVQGDRISFTVYGEDPYTAYVGNTIRRGYPKMVVSGTLDGNKIKLVLAYTTVSDTGKEPGPAIKCEMVAEKSSQ
jgi:hypothetical protein